MCCSIGVANLATGNHFSEIPRYSQLPPPCRIRDRPTRRANKRSRARRKIAERRRATLLAATTGTIRRLLLKRSLTTRGSARPVAFSHNNNGHDSGRVSVCDQSEYVIRGETEVREAGVANFASRHGARSSRRLQSARCERVSRGDSVRYHCLFVAELHRRWCVRVALRQAASRRTGQVSLESRFRGTEGVNFSINVRGH